MSGALAGLQKPVPAPVSKKEWPFTLARLVVWDEEASYNDEDCIVDIVPLEARVIQCALLTDGSASGPAEGEPNYIAYYLSVEEDIEIKPEWVGKKMNIEVAPSVLRALDDELEEAVDKWDGTIA